MNPWPRALRWLGLGIGGLAAMLALAVLALVAVGEWQVRSAAPRAAPLVFEVAPAAADAVASATAPVLILLHGAGLNGRMWDPVRSRLDTRYRIIALDLPGHGSRRNEVFTLEAAVATVATAAQSVAPAPVMLVGDSLGGYTAMGAAGALPPAQLRGLVLAGCSGERGLGPALSYVTNLVFVRLLSLRFDEHEFAERALPLFGVAEAHRPAIIAAGVNIHSVPAAQRALMFVDFRSRLAAVDTPVLVVNGDLDEGAIKSEASLLAAAKQATSHRFENTRHGVSMRRSTEFAGLINAFAGRVFSPRAPATHAATPKP